MGASRVVAMGKRTPAASHRLGVRRNLGPRAKLGQLQSWPVMALCRKRAHAMRIPKRAALG